MNKPTKYYVKQISARSDKCHVISKDNNMPCYDDERDGNDAPLVFKDWDVAQEYCDKLNKDEELSLMIEDNPPYPNQWESSI